MAHVALVTREFNKPTLSCLTWPQSYPVHLGYMYKGTKKNLTALPWSFPPFLLNHFCQLTWWQFSDMAITAFYSLQEYSNGWSVLTVWPRGQRGLWGISSFRIHWFHRSLHQPVVHRQTRGFVLHLLNSVNLSGLMWKTSNTWKTSVVSKGCSTG